MPNVKQLKKEVTLPKDAFTKEKTREVETGYSTTRHRVRVDQLRHSRANILERLVEELENRLEQALTAEERIDTLDRLFDLNEELIEANNTIIYQKAGVASGRFGSIANERIIDSTDEFQAIRRAFVYVSEAIDYVKSEIATSKNQKEVESLKVLALTIAFHNSSFTQPIREFTTIHAGLSAFTPWQAKAAVQYKGNMFVAKLAEIAGVEAYAVEESSEELPTIESRSHRFPEGNVVATALKQNDLFNMYLTVISLFKKVAVDGKSAPEMPSSSKEAAQWMYKTWYSDTKISEAEEANGKKEFARKYETVQKAITELKKNELL